MTTQNGQISHAALEEPIRCLRRGGVVVFPTDTLYGLGADAFSPEAVGRVFDIKGRASSSGLPLLIADTADLDMVAVDITGLALALAEEFWPGPLTLVLRRSDRVPAIATGGLDTVAVRIPDHPVPRALARSVGRPITGTSANRTDGPDPVTAGQVKESLGGAVDYIIDAGPSPLGAPSTILDLSGARPALLRAGAVPREALELACGTPID
ncbi:MAG: threonylcarbamoyl-AMP synthase [Dehalococcoidia bacterium]|nr:threonylcarbamoyl-AMP synthase [Dehalococcoidia bacterium]